MKYQFPFIENIHDVLPAIKGADEFSVTQKDGYTVINYHVEMADSFPSVWENGEYNRHAVLRRECRGLIFCSETGNILRRPLHKFFNLNQKEETHQNIVDLVYEDHHILEKLDGSMIVPFLVGDRLIWGTKMGDTEVSAPIYDFVLDNPNYRTAALNFIANHYSPIFEWCSNKQRIVIDHPVDQLILIAVRDMHTGDYVPYDDMVSMADTRMIPVVRKHDISNDINNVIEHTRDLTGSEGYVIRFATGHMTKVKSAWYVAIHKAKEAILWDRNIVSMIFENQLDDIKPDLPEVDRAMINNFESNLTDFINKHKVYLSHVTSKYVDEMKIDRKTFALEYAKFFNSYDKAIIFSLWDDNSVSRAYDFVCNTIKKHLGSNTKYNELREAWFPHIKFN